MQTSRPLPAELDIAAKVGVLLYQATTEPHAVLTAVVERLRARGVTVGGILQRVGERLPGGKHSFWLDDIATGHAIRLDEPRGPSARSCTLDTDALAQGAYLLRHAAEAGLDVIIVSRFGSLEAEGNGLRSEIADAICSGSVVLIPVRAALLPDLEVFLGAKATLLPPSPTDVAAWAEHASARRQSAAIG